ncbi:MAG: 23S rRNA (uracil(1939)-C(5))-methyltransferase RlmD [Halanaerobiaceae bacterium]|nr:23S rRNA (uracil(1939)-C(5))-methyltransferase RlmD [Halanaerobiaceae bacterium]
MKKGKIIDIIIENYEFPNIGIGIYNGNKIKVKNTLPEQRAKVLISRKKKDYYEARLLKQMESADFEENPSCIHYDLCGGCSRQTVSYQKQLEIKAEQVLALFKKNGLKYHNYHGITPSPLIYEYRNKMEYSFGDMAKDGVLQLGLHPAGRRFDVITVDECQLVDEDFRTILSYILNYCREHNLKRYHIMNREGCLRHLIIRKGLKTGEILVNLHTTSSLNHDMKQLTEGLKNLKLKGKLTGFLQTINDDLSDAIKCEELIVHYGVPYFFEELLNLRFKITPFSFFQPNTFAAEKLYQTVQSFLSDYENKVILDLYCGTGTISQVLAKRAHKVYGIEIVEEAVKVAEENSRINNLDNCYFFAGDVFEKIEILPEKPDLIVIDPPRPGINPAALKKIIALNTEELIYVSCNPLSLVRDLKEFAAAQYEIKDLKCVDMFPHTHHVETVVLISK